MSITEEIKAEKVPWIPLILLTAFLSFIAIAAYRFLVPQGLQCYFNFGVMSQVAFVAVYPQLLLAIAYVFRRWFMLSSSKLTYLYTSGIVSSFALGFGFRDYCIQFARHRIFDTLGILNVWWEPPVSAVESMLRGGIPTDWVAWGPIVFVISLLWISFFFFTSSVALIFRRSWLDVEKVPFPLVMASHELLKVVDTGGGKSYGGKKPFSIGLLLGFVFIVPIFMGRMFPWFPDIYGWRSITPCSTWVLPENHPLSEIIGLTKISVDPISVALFFLAPLSISFNVWFWTLVMMVLEQVAFYMGYYTGAPSMGGSVRICCNAGPGSGPPFYWPIPSMLGGFLALTTMYIFLHRGYVLETMKAALHSPNVELEKNEVMKYRSMYIMLIITAIMGVASLMILGIDLIAAIILLLTSCFTTWFAMTLVFGMAGLGAADRLLWSPGFLRLVWPDPSTAPTNLDYVMSHFFAGHAVNQPNYTFGNGYYITIQSLKMASLTGTNNRNTFLVAAVCWLVAVPVIQAASVWTANLYGVTTLLGVGNCAIYEMCDSGPLKQARFPPVDIYLTYGVAGFLWTALLAFLHARFIWFPFEPIGFIIAASFPGQWFGVWSVFLVAWIAKTLVLRTGGSALYEKYALPFVGGFIAGVVLANTIGIFVGTVRFFIPF